VDRPRSKERSNERRRFPGALSYLWCRTCKTRFAVAGRKRTGRETPAIELIVCPECRAMRRMVLPVNVGAPFRVLSKADRSRSE
jgi:hypothetical protein